MLSAWCPSVEWTSKRSSGDITLVSSFRQRSGLNIFLLSGQAQSY